MYKITKQQMQSLADYLVAQPYKNVFGLIDMIATLPVIEIETTKPKVEDKPKPKVEDKPKETNKK